MSVGYIILIVALIVMVLVIGVLFHTIEQRDKEWKKYYANLRRSYEISLEELQKDIRVRDELLKAYTHRKVG